MDWVRALGPLPQGVMAEVEDGHLIVFVRRDMLHLDADALHDRLAYWSLHALAKDVPAASAGISFRHASPAEPHEESTLDLQEGWLGLEPTFALDLARAAPGELERFAALVPRFLKVVEQTGRPEGFRAPDVGNVE